MLTKKEIAGLKPGDKVRLCHFAGKSYEHYNGMIVEVVDPDVQLNFTGQTIGWKIHCIQFTPPILEGENQLECSLVNYNNIELVKSYSENKISGLTKEESSKLKVGDTVEDIKTGEKITLEEFEFNNYNGRDIIYIIKKVDNNNSLALPYYFDELSLVKEETDKCKCDIISLMSVGCKCGGQ